MREFSVARNQEMERENEVQFFTTVSAEKGKLGCHYSIYENDELLKKNFLLPVPPTDVDALLLEAASETLIGKSQEIR